MKLMVNVERWIYSRLFAVLTGAVVVDVVEVRVRLEQMALLLASKSSCCGQITASAEASAATYIEAIERRCDYSI